MLPLILASASPYRRELLKRLKLPFTVQISHLSEDRYPNESATVLCERLAVQKAQIVAATHPDSLIIGCDQVAVLNHSILGKPGDYANAFQQLTEASGNTLWFHSALCLLNSKTQRKQLTHITTEVRYRKLSPNQIEKYLHTDKPYDCAGSARIESLGISLVESVISEDPTALIGLPLITLTQFLLNEGVTIL